MERSQHPRFHCVRQHAPDIFHVPSDRMDCSLASQDPPWQWTWNQGRAFKSFSDMWETSFPHSWPAYYEACLKKGR